MSPIKKCQRHCYDLNVPLSATLTSSKRKQQSRLYQTRLHQLKYDGMAFCHTAYGRLNLDRDDADVALPWKDLIASSPSSSLSSESPKKQSQSSGAEEIAFGRSNSLGMKIYRRLNIIVEEVSDVSRILLPANDGDMKTNKQSSASTSSSAISQLLQKYDIVSLQPMNEAALQNICELLSSSSSSENVSTGGPGSNNNTKFIDIIVLEYATGSRGGYGLPYKLRKDYVVKALQAGVTFELCYGPAVLDPKRRQGFLRTLMDFQTTFNGIQKKHTLLNKQHQQNNRKKSDKFPLVLSSCSRQNYTLGTDEGALALRSYHDIKFLVCHLVGDSKGWFDEGGDGLDGDEFVDDGHDALVGGSKNKKNKRKAPVVTVSAAERVLAKASDRVLGVVGVDPQRSAMQGKRKRGLSQSRYCVSSAAMDGAIDDEDEEDGDIMTCTNNGTSLVEWLSVPLHKKRQDKNQDDTHNNGMNGMSQIENKGAGETIPSSPIMEEATKKHTADAVATSLMNREENGDEDSQEDEEDDVEDGFIAL